MNEIINKSEDIKQYVDNYVIAAMIDGIIKCGKPYIIKDIWYKLHENEINNIDINMDINCYTLAILAASQSNNEELVDELVSEIKDKFMQQMLKNKELVSWNKILTAYGYLKKYDKMWSQYYELKKYLKPDIQCLCIMANIDHRAEYQIIALNEALKYIKNWDKIKETNYGELKGLYRVAVAVNHTKMKDLLWNRYLKHETDYIDVIAYCQFDGVSYSFDNLYKSENKYLLNLVDELIEKSNHVIDVKTIHPEMSNNISKHKMISYHSEKKALAFLIDHDVNTISINVNMRMCDDCHAFFCSVSKLYPHKVVECVDPKIKHVFMKGQCSCTRKN